MRGHQRPGKTRRSGIGQDTAAPIQEIIPVAVIKKYLSAMDSPHNDGMQSVWGVWTSFPWHIKLVLQDNDLKTELLTNVPKISSPKSPQNPVPKIPKSAEAICRCRRNYA
jgi:hypothetical protein